MAPSPGDRSRSRRTVLRTWSAFDFATAKALRQSPREGRPTDLLISRLKISEKEPGSSSSPLPTQVYEIPRLFPGNVKTLSLRLSGVLRVMIQTRQGVEYHSVPSSIMGKERQKSTYEIACIAGDGVPGSLSPTHGRTIGFRPESSNSVWNRSCIILVSLVELSQPNSSTRNLASIVAPGSGFG